MRRELDEMNLTAYALGELQESEREAVESQLAASAEDRRFVEEIRTAAQRVSDELARQTPEGLDAVHYAAIEMRLHHWHSPRPIDRRAVLRGRIGLAMSVAASIAIIAGVFGAAWLILFRQHEVASSNPTSQPFTHTVLIPLQRFNVGPSRAEQGITLVHAAGNFFVNVADQSVSSFAINPDTSSYRGVREDLLHDRRPSHELVRVEGLINAFQYELPLPIGDADFAGQIEIGACPWRSDCQLARIAIQARTGANVVAEDATTQVAFNTSVVNSYRLIGYEDTTSGPSRGEDVRGGHAVTALYEVIPLAKANLSADWLTLSVRYRRSGSTVERVIKFQGRATTGDSTSADFRFAAAVAEFGMVLREGPDGALALLDSAIELAESARGPDASGERGEFIEMARRARQLFG